MPFERRAVPWLVAAATSALFAFPLQLHLTRFPRGLLTDDAYFYVKIAWNLGGGRGSTFDGLHVTDGYHLIWAWLLAAASAVTGYVTSDPWVHLGSMLWVYFMVCWAIAIGFGRTWTDRLLLLSMGIVFKAMMETTLLALVLLVCARECLRQPASSLARPRWWLLVLLALMSLIRIDAALIGGILVLSSWFGGTSEGEASAHALTRAKAVAIGWVAVAAGAALQVLVHFWLFGHWTTVSMEMKGFRDLGFLSRLSRNLTGWYLQNSLSTALFVFFCGLAVFAAIQRPARDRVRHLVVVAAPAAFVLFHLLANATINYWYFVPAACVHVWYFLEYGPGQRARTGRAGRAAIALVPLLFLGKWGVDSVIRRTEIAWARTFLEEVRQRVPPSEPIFQVDAAGWIGWFSERTVINGDGLVNDHAYVARLRDRTLAGYLDEQGVRYIVTNMYGKNDRIVDIGGLVVPSSAVESLVPQPQGYPNATAFGLCRLK